MPAGSMPVHMGRNGSLADGVDQSRLFALLAGARQVLDHDPVLARYYLDLVSRHLQQACGETSSCHAILAERPKHEPPVTGGLAGWQAGKVTDHIERHLGRNITVDELAGVASLSTGHFCRAFKVTIGEAPHAYVIRQRVRRAQLMMLKTTDSLSEIAFACGLTDQAHLTRLFKRHVGTTPLVWRRNLQGEVVSDPLSAEA